VKALRAAVRDLLRAPAFSALVVVTLGLGIGATTAMFSVVDAVLLRPLPYPNVERFSEVWIHPETGAGSPGVPETAFVRLRQDLADIAEVEGYQMGSAVISGGREPEIVGAPSISPRLLELVGGLPVLGRLFTNDDLSSQTRVVIISHRYWTTQFGSDPGIIGRVVDIDDQPHTVIGVMSARTRYPEANAAIWRPMDPEFPQASRRRVQMVAVRHSGVTIDQLSARLAAASTMLIDAKLIAGGSVLRPDLLLQERFGRNDHRAFWLMFGAVLLVLLVACVNVSNLLLARASARHGEFALRCALGAGRSRLVMSAFSEALMLAVAGAAVGIVLAQVLLSLLLQILPPQLTYLTATASQIDRRVLIFAVLISLVACLVAGFLPSLRASRTDPMDAIKRHSQTGSGRDDLWHGLLIAGQLSMVLVLLAGAGLLMRSFVRLTNVETGFDPENLVLLDLELPIRRYSAPGSALRLIEEVERRIEADGVTKLTVAGGAPLTSPAFSFNITPEAEGGTQVDFSGQMLPFSAVAGDYFTTIGIPIIAGRSFEPDDAADVIVVNDKLARRYWGEVAVVGKRFRRHRTDPWKTVIGVVGDVKQLGLDDPTGHGMEFYTPHPRNGGGGHYALLVRATRDPGATIAAVKQAVWSLDARLPFSDAMTMSDRIGESLYRQRFFVRLSSAFTVIAAVLALIGVYGAFSYWVARRHRELAIRMAIGASPDRVVGIVLARALRLAAAGVVVGLAISLAGAQVMKTMLFEIDPRDPATLMSVTILLAIAALAACAIPAVRAARVDPMTTLRAE
jgi:predicted permease